MMSRHFGRVCKRNMFRFVVVDMPQVGAATIALALAALLYMIYRDLRMLVQMVVDLKEEVMLSRMATSLSREGFGEESCASNSRASSDNGQCEGGFSGDTRSNDEKKGVARRERKTEEGEETGAVEVDSVVGEVSE